LINIMAFQRLILLLLLSCLLLSAQSPLLAQEATKRLILKDGSYQIVTKFELSGDRVHYYSAERAEWEDVPSSMVDWDATNQYVRDNAANKNSPASRALAKEMEAERQEEEAQSPHVAPGLRLPFEGGIYALDTYLSEPELVPLDQQSGEVNRHVGRNVLRSAINPISGSKHTIELAGPSAKVQVHASLPTIYINLEPVEEDAQTSLAGAASNKPEENSKAKESEKKKSDVELPWDRFRIVRVQVKGDKRIVGAIKTNLAGKVSQEQDSIPVTAEQFAEGWVKLTPKAPLQPGEYALAEMLGKQGMNSFVWDFGVHPGAPANLAVIRAEKSKPEAPAPAPDTLQQRK
jgi:hypothetical protein